MPSAPYVPDEQMATLELPPRLVDATILVVVVLQVVTGVVTLVAGGRGDAWLYDVHAVAGVSLVVLLGWKLRRVAPRVRGWPPDRRTTVSIVTAVVAVAALATGVGWAFGLTLPGFWTLLTLHAVLGLLVVPPLALHLRTHFRLPRSSDVEGRRTALRYAGLAAVGAAAWAVDGAVNRALDTAAVGKRFTGSRPAGGPPGNAYPVTMWVADDPDPIDRDDWALSVRGAVEEELELSYDDVAEGVADADSTAADDAGVARTATLDCTSGWYAERDWAGVSVGGLLDRAGVAEGARWVRFRSVTGYRWSLPLEEARGALLATHVGGEALSHGHGFPLRLVAPGRRGFQWVKWVEAVEVRRRPDPGQWAAIFVSGFTGGSGASEESE